MRVAAEGRGLIYTSASFSGQSDFVSQKFCICVNTVVTKSACPTAAEKRLSASICLCRRCRSQPLSSVSRKQRYNTLDFAEQNRVPTGMLLAPIGNPEPRDFTPLDTPHIFLENGTQTVKCSLTPFLRKYKTAVLSILARMKNTAVFILPHSQIFSKTVCVKFFALCRCL